MSKPTKLNSMRVLEQHKVPYEVLTYDADTRDAEEVAELVGMPPFMVYKTLIVQSIATDKPYIVMLACDKHLALKQLATALGEKKMKMASHTDAERLTNLQVGGISALMLLDKNWKVYVDKAITEQQNIVISAGQRGLQLRVPVLPLMNLLKARLIDVAIDKAEE
jgi:Cys-tRNA(Pro)/Cys-tRNA(Cys) deacylase